MLADREANELLKLISINDSSIVYVGYDNAGPNPEVISPLPEVVAYRVNTIKNSLFPDAEFQANLRR
jgi:hypothetical protein